MFLCSYSEHFRQIVEQKKAKYIWYSNYLEAHFAFFFVFKTHRKETFVFKYLTLFLISYDLQNLSYQWAFKENELALYIDLLQKRETIMNTINKHFYYFGTDEEPLIMPFGYDGNAFNL